MLPLGGVFNIIGAPEMIQWVGRAYTPMTWHDKRGTRNGNIAAGTWTRNDDVSPIKHEHIPASYVSLPAMVIVGF